MSEALISAPAAVADTRWGYVLIGSERDADLSATAQAAAGSATVRILRGQRCGSVTGLYREWAAALQFPYYFGNNWDAFDECVNDLARLGSLPVILYVTNVQRVLTNADEGFATLMDALAKAARRRATTTAARQGSASSNQPHFASFFNAPSRSGNPCNAA